ncbi:MAG: cupredoxin domain-containing protein [Magnetovibrio sp.]|nr:cupredoxin domain-containing protein [Magnetovibrio sp.]
MLITRTLNLAAIALATVLSTSVAQASETQMPSMSMNMNMSMDAQEEEITFGEAGKLADVSRTITVTISDLAYDLKKLTVKNGETIRFIIVNKDEMEHEFTLGKKVMQAADRVKMAVPYAVSVGDLETKELIWTFKGADKIEFDCNIPGHYEAGMTGEITITG